MALIGVTTMVAGFLFMAISGQTVTINTDWRHAFSTPCAELDVDACLDDDRCTSIDAWSNGSDGCVDHQLPKRAVACQDSPPLCLTATHWAESPDGECLLFSSSCTPPGWKPCTGCESIPVHGQAR